MRKSVRGLPFARAFGVLALGMVGALQSSTVSAFSFDLGGDIQGAFDTDVTYGYMRRMEDAQADTKAPSYGNRVLFNEQVHHQANHSVLQVFLAQHNPRQARHYHPCQNHLHHQSHPR